MDHIRDGTNMLPQNLSYQKAKDFICNNSPQSQLPLFPLKKGENILPISNEIENHNIEYSNKMSVWINNPTKEDIESTYDIILMPMIHAASC